MLLVANVHYLRAVDGYLLLGAQLLVQRASRGHEPLQLLEYQYQYVVLARREVLRLVGEREAVGQYQHRLLPHAWGLGC